MNIHSIRNKLLLLTMLPPLVMLVVIVLHFVQQDSKLLLGVLQERGDTVSRYLASAAEYGVVTGNIEQLNHIGGSLLHGDVVALRVYDIDDQAIFTRGDLSVARDASANELTSGQCGGDDGHLLFCAPILFQALPVGDYEEVTTGLEQSAVGRVELLLTTHSVDQKRMTMMRWSLFMALLVLLSGVLLSRRVERQIVEPLSGLSHTVARVGAGDLELQVSESARGELLALQQGINAMIAALANSRENMESEIRLATERLRNTMGALEQRNRELLVEQQRAESASLAKSQFLATMSHEIRTPLSGIIGMLQLLRDSSHSRRQLDYIDSLESASQSLRQLIDDILDFSRLEVGKLAIQNRPFTPLEVIEEVMVMLTPSAHHKGLEFVLHIDGGLPGEVLGDPLRFRQVLINLTANAIKFTDEGEVLLRVRPLEPTAGGASVLRFEIHDTGIGIAEDKQSLVFESFTQVDAGDARSFGGSGLGTTVSRELVQMMGGSIGLSSELGRGSCFWFELPWELTGEAPAEASPTPACSALLLDEQRSAAEAIEGLLRAEGLKVRRVDDAPALWAALAEGSFDWVFIADNDDSGASLLQRLAAELPSDTHLCQLSYVNGLRSEDERVEHLSKPLLPSALRGLLRERRESHNAAAEIETHRAALNLLLAEDEDINAKVIGHFLEQGGHRVTRVKDGEAALEQLRSNDFDGVLMDLRMPGLDGLEATRRWRAEEAAGAAGANPRRVPIIALTANASEDDRQRCVAAGMDDYLTKPVDSQLLLSCLEQRCRG